MLELPTDTGMLWFEISHWTAECCAGELTRTLLEGVKKMLYSMKCAHCVQLATGPGLVRGPIEVRNWRIERTVPVGLTPLALPQKLQRERIGTIGSNLQIISHLRQAKLVVQKGEELLIDQDLCHRDCILRYIGDIT